MPFKWNYATDLSRRKSSTNGNDSTARITPFVAKVYVDGEYVPIYTPYDATDKAQGISWLTDDLSACFDYDAVRGKTSTTPKGVVDFVGAKTLIADPASYPGFSSTQQNATQEVKGAVNFSGVVNAPNGTVGQASRLNTDKTISVKVGSSEKSAGIIFTGEEDAVIQISKIDASTVEGVLSVDCIPQGAMSKMIAVQDEAGRFALTADDVSKGDMVQQIDTGTIYVVIDMDNLDNESGYTEMTAGNATYAETAGAFSSNRRISLTGAINGEVEANGSNGWTIPTTYAGTVPIAQGGTNASTVAGARKNLGLGETDGAVPVANGGTGATTAAVARENLGIHATEAELGYLSGLTGNVQDQIDDKAELEHTHLYAGSDVAGGAAAKVAISENTSTTKEHFILFSDLDDSTSNPKITGVAGYNNNLKYTLNNNQLSVNISGKASTAGIADSAGIADKVRNNLTITLGNNSGGTVYNGGSATDINITPSSIGAASTDQLNGYLPLSGGTLVGSLYYRTDTYLDANNLFLYGKKSDKTTRVQLVGMSADDSIQIGPAEDDKSCLMTHAGGAVFRKGEIRLKSDNVGRDETSASAIYNQSPIIFSDKDNNGFGTLRANKNTNNRNQLEMSIYREINGVMTYNTLNLYIDNTGNCTYSVSSPTNFRTAISAAPTKHEHSASDITSGTLPLSRGGVGATTKAGARANIGITSGTAAAPTSGTAGDIYIQYA